MSDTRKPRKCKPPEQRLVGMHIRVKPNVREFFMGLPAPSTAVRTALRDYMDRNCS